MNENNAESNVSGNLNKCSRFYPNIHKLAFCQFCQASKRVHSHKAVQATEHKLIGSQRFYITVDCQDENCTLSIINGEKMVSLYDSGVVKFEEINSNNISEIDLSLFRVSVTFPGRNTFELNIDTQKYVMESNETITLQWKEFLKKLAEQSSSKKSSLVPEPKLLDMERSVVTSDPISPDTPVTPIVRTTPVVIVDTPVSPRNPATRFNIRTNSPTVDTKQPQQTCEKLEADLKSERKSVDDATKLNEDLQKKLLILTKKVTELENENKGLVAKMNKEKKDAESFNDNQLRKASVQMCRDIKSLEIKPSSYEFLVNYLFSEDSQSPAIKSFLRHQLEFLIHRSPLQIGSNLSLFQYLSQSIAMSPDSLATFVFNFLEALAKQINPSLIKTKCDLISNLKSLIQSVVEMNPSPQLLPSNKSFQQTALEIAYLIAPKDAKQSQLSNGYSEPASVTDQFNDLMKSINGDSVTKILLIDLGNYIQDRYRTEAVANVTSRSEEIITDSIIKNPVQDHFNELWDNLYHDLHSKQQEIDDLHVALSAFSIRIMELEKECTISRDKRNIDSYVNYYTSMAQDLCPQCQIKVCNNLKTPVSSMVDKVVDELTSYWVCVNDLAAFLAKKKSMCDVKEVLDMTKKCSLKYESLVKQFQELSHRTITNPGCSKTLPLTTVNDL